MLDKALGEQARHIVTAAKEDIQSIVEGKSLELPNWLKPHWGNRDQVNDRIDNPTIIDAASAAANVAKLIVLLTNQTPGIALEVQKGVLAAGYVAEGILGSPIFSLVEKGQGFLEEAAEALRKVAQLNNVQQTTIDKYINNRFAEIKAYIPAEKKVEGYINR